MTLVMSYGLNSEHYKLVLYNKTLLLSIPPSVLPEGYGGKRIIFGQVIRDANQLLPKKIGQIIFKKEKLIFFP